MCGIHFVLTQDTFASKTDDYMNQAFLANQVRGMHSSGIFQVNNKLEINMYKQAVDASTFIGTEQAKKIITLTPRSPLTVGHVRHATAGSINDENAHPFSVMREDGSELVGVHNGTLRNWKHQKGAKETAVDSAWAFMMLAEHGDDAFQYFDGAFAMVWYDSAEPGYVFMARNKERPLHFMTSKDRKTILGASELGMLGWLTARNNIEPVADKHSAFRYLEPNVIYKFSLNDVGAFSSWKMQDYDIRNNAYVPPVNNYNSLHPQNRGYYGGASNDEVDDMYTFPTRRANTYQDYELVRQTNFFSDLDKVFEEIEFRAPEGSLPDVTEVDLNKAVDAATLVEDGISNAIRRWKKAEIQRKPQSPAVAAAEIRMESMLDSNALFMSDPNDKAATRAEIGRAQGIAVYGQVGKFYGILYDKEEDIVLGQLQLCRRGVQVEVEAEMRFATRHAEAKYVARVEPTLVTVIGIVPPSGAFGETYVIAELSNSNKAQLEQHTVRLAKVN